MSTNGRDRFVPAASGKGATYTGWQEPLSALVQRLQRAIQGVRDRLRVPSTEMSIWPSAVTGRRLFTPEAGVELVDSDQNNASSQPINVVVRSGRRYTIPMIFPGPGVFIGRWLKVALYMRLHDPELKGDTEAWLPMCSNTGAGTGTNAATDFPYTCRFSLFPLQSQGIPALNGGGDFRPPCLNYFWNLQDPRSGRLYSDRSMSHMMLLPSTWQATTQNGGNALADGDLYDLKVPWVFERDGQLTFTMDPITDLYQFDSSINGTANPMFLPFDDRENGKRDQSVLVQVEMHGFRFETMQDAVRAGALTQRWEDESDGAVIPMGTAGLARKTR